MKKFLCVCLLILALILCACEKSETEAVTKMIDLTDYTVTEVIAWANENDVASKFTYVYSADTDKPAGSVIAQSIESGEPITDGVVITVASKPLLMMGSGEKVAVPNVIGKSLSEAKNELTALGFKVDYKYESSGKDKDTVLLSDPLPGNSVAKNSKILLTLSAGAKERQISITLEIPTKSAEDNRIKVYVDGELDRSKTVTLDASVKSKAFTFQGTGTKEIKFKINGEVAAVYEITFETGEVNKIG